MRRKRSWLTLFSVALLSAPAPAQHWAFLPPQPPTIPTLASTPVGEQVTTIDRFILARLAQAQLPPAPLASKRELVRRAYFDLLGLPPTPEQVHAFVADARPDAWEKLIDQLLESKHYGERWGRHWLDVVRYADSGGYETDIYYRNAWRYRDYVVKSFNDDKPYNVFVQEQIAGDELWPDDLALDPKRVYEIPAAKRRHLEARTGTGFFALGPRIHESGLDGKRLDYETKTDWVDTLAATFLGVTLGCARCHDHKFDPFTQHDYFALIATFASAQLTEEPLWTAMGEADWRQSFPRIVAVEEARRALLAFDAQPPAGLSAAVRASKRHDLLAAIGEAVMRLPSATGGQHTIPYDPLMQIPTVSVLQRKHPQLVAPVFVLERGELAKPTEQVQPALPSDLAAATGTPALSPDPFEARQRLALWITKRDHPLTARVLVNRLWQWHFGAGLVETPNDFGIMGSEPSHPELLDWLALTFADQDFSIKSMHRLIMRSRTYRQSSRFAPDAHLREDPQNRLLWRMNRRRLEAEILWDAVHSVAQTINLKQGGPPVMPALAADEIASLRDRWHWVTSADPQEHTRRGLYVLVRRNFKFPMFDVFDAPLTSVSCPERDVTTVAPQALWGLNNRSVLQQASKFADRVMAASSDTKTRVDQAWQLALGRPPTVVEVEQAVTHLTDTQQDGTSREVAWQRLCLALFNLTEFAFID